MAALIGRTVSKFTNFVVDDSSGTIRDIPINTLSVVGVAYESQDLTAFQDAVMGALPGMPSAPIDISGPFDTTAVVSASGTGTVPALSGSHTVLSAVNGLLVPLTVDIQIGVRQTWETGEPQFGITSSATSGYLLMTYSVDLSTMIYTAHFELFPGSSLPAWGTAAEE